MVEGLMLGGVSLVWGRGGGLNRLGVSVGYHAHGLRISQWNSRPYGVHFQATSRVPF